MSFHLKKYKRPHIDTKRDRTITQLSITTIENYDCYLKKEQLQNNCFEFAPNAT